EWNSQVYRQAWNETFGLEARIADASAPGSYWERCCAEETDRGEPCFTSVREAPCSWDARDTGSARLESLWKSDEKANDTGILDGEVVSDHQLPDCPCAYCGRRRVSLGGGWSGRVVYLDAGT